jgi:dynein heavy chain
VQQSRRDFVLKVIQFRSLFMAELPYHIQQSSPEIINNAYNKISEFYTKLKNIEFERDQLANQETLFDLERSIYKELKECSVELVNLKKMWDLIALIDMQFESWRSTLWENIDTDLLTTLIKDMQAKQCNPTQPQNKDIKNYRAFQALNERVKNMNTILPLIAQLHSPFMLERHWRRLESKIVKKPIPFKSEKFCLADLIQLELFKVGEDVSELVDSAQKEDKINKKLDGIKAIWED